MNQRLVRTGFLALCLACAATAGAAPPLTTPTTPDPVTPAPDPGRGEGSVVGAGLAQDGVVGPNGAGSVNPPGPGGPPAPAPGPSFAPPGLRSLRGDMAVFIIRAKTNNVFPTVTSGAPVSSPPAPSATSGDSSGPVVPSPPATHGQPPTPPNDGYIDPVYTDWLRGLSGSTEASSAAARTPQEETLASIIQDFFR